MKKKLMEFFVTTSIFFSFMGMLVSIVGIFSEDWSAFICGLIIMMPGFFIGKKQIKEFIAWIILPPSEGNKKN